MFSDKTGVLGVFCFLFERIVCKFKVYGEEDMACLKQNEGNNREPKALSVHKMKMWQSILVVKAEHAELQQFAKAFNTTIISVAVEKLYTVTDIPSYVS